MSEIYFKEVNINTFGFWKKLWLSLTAVRMNYPFPEENVVLEYYLKNGCYYVTKLEQKEQDNDR